MINGRRRTALLVPGNNVASDTQAMGIPARSFSAGSNNIEVPLWEF